MPDLDELHRFFRMSHIAIGFAGLGLFWIPVFARKGSRLHIASGRLFAWCAYFVGVTGLLASVWGLVHPASFLSGSEFGAMSDEQARLAVENLRFILSITGFLALAVLAGVTLGTRIIKAGKVQEDLRTPLLLLLLNATVIWSALLAAYGAGTLIAAYVGWHFIPPAAANPYWINVTLGVIGVYGTVGDLKFIRAPQTEPLARQSMHIECMIGTGAAFYAAFFLFGATRLFSLPGYWLMAPVVPIVIGAIVSKFLTRRYECRLSPSPAEGAAV